jgi:hypothetical protein
MIEHVELFDPPPTTDVSPLDSDPATSDH